MKMKFGAIVTDGRGKIGGHVASKNRAGAYLRTKVTPVNLQTPDQSVVRNRFAQLSQAWRGLTQVQRDAWNNAVSDFASTDIFGDVKNLTGAQLFQKLNNNLLNVGSAMISVPPAAGAVTAITSLSVAVSLAESELSITFTPAIAAGSAVLLDATPAVSAGKDYVKNLFRQISVLPAATSSPHDAGAEYIAKFGELPAVGSKVFVRVKVVNTATGQAGTELSASTVVSA